MSRWRRYRLLAVGVYWLFAGGGVVTGLLGAALAIVIPLASVAAVALGGVVATYYIVGQLNDREGRRLALNPPQPRPEWQPLIDRYMNDRSRTATSEFLLAMRAWPEPLEGLVNVVNEQVVAAVSERGHFRVQVVQVVAGYASSPGFVVRWRFELADKLHGWHQFGAYAALDRATTAFATCLRAVATGWAFAPQDRTAAAAQAKLSRAHKGLLASGVTSMLPTRRTRW